MEFEQLNQAFISTKPDAIVKNQSKIGFILFLSDLNEDKVIKEIKLISLLLVLSLNGEMENSYFSVLYSNYGYDLMHKYMDMIDTSCLTSFLS